MGKPVKFVKKAVKFVKRRGARGVMEKMHLANPKNELLKHMEFIMDRKEYPFDEKQYQAHKNDEVKILNWIIPEMGAGSGGHTTIFRMVSHLENLGYHSRIYLFLSPNYRDNASVKTFTKEHFPILDDRVEMFWDVSEADYAHATICTSWETAYCLRDFNNTISKFYFVQDFEPHFYPHGSYYEFAKNTYKFGFRGITAGDWLKDKLREEFGMVTDSFWFSYEKGTYKDWGKKENKKRVFFYARPYTARRDFELGLLALNELCRRMPKVEVIFAGEDISNYVIPFKHQNLGIITPKQLSQSYAMCDICLVMSNTNLSLVPLEVMASGSVAICSKGENSSWLVSEENAVLVDYDPMQIADVMEYYLNNPTELNKIREKGRKFAETTSWEKEAEKIAVALQKGIAEDELNIQKTAN